MTGQKKSGDKLLELVLEDIRVIVDKYKAILISWTTDDGPDGKRMRCLLVRMLPKIIATVCWAHQINLVFGEYISLPGIREWVELALDIIKWFNAHSTALDLLREEQRITPPNQVLSLLLPVSTRWTPHYLSISRLLLCTVQRRKKSRCQQ